MMAGWLAVFLCSQLSGRFGNSKVGRGLATKLHPHQTNQDHPGRLSNGFAIKWNFRGSGKMKSSCLSFMPPFAVKTTGRECSGEAKNAWKPSI